MCQLLLSFREKKTSSSRFNSFSSFGSASARTNINIYMFDFFCRCCKQHYISIILWDKYTCRDNERRWIETLDNKTNRIRCFYHSLKIGDTHTQHEMKRKMWQAKEQAKFYTKLEYLWRGQKKSFLAQQLIRCDPLCAMRKSRFSTRLGDGCAHIAKTCSLLMLAAIRCVCVCIKRYIYYTSSVSTIHM